MPPELSESYAFCRALAKRAGNFYFAFWSLPADRFWAMCALYGFTRLVDDAGDDPTLPLEQRTLLLQQWRQNLTSALAGAPPQHIVFPALLDTVKKYDIPTEYLFALIDGVEMDLQPVSYNTFQDLSGYCYHVAGVIGLCCIHVWGFHDERAKPAAILCGQAFQLTNILRDIREDFSNGRCYLPQADLAQFQYTEDDLGRGVRDDRFRQLMTFEVRRARELYASGNELTQYLSPVGKPIFDTMVKLYRGLLDEIERADYDVFSKRIRLSTWRKLRFAAGGMLQRFL
ncbi:MAG: phytoene/squalene synthase family protein [Planctomycetota bacterium]